MNLPEDFRFRSEFDLFCQVVNAAESMLQKRELYLLFGFESEISFQYFLTDDEFADYGLPCPRQEFERILKHEVVYFLGKNLTDEETVPLSLLRYLKAKKIPKADAEEVIDLFGKKAAYAVEHLLSEEARRRFRFKAFTTSQKILDFDWDTCRYTFSNNQDQPYVQFKISVLDDLPDINENRTSGGCETVRFVCDSHDLDYLIVQLMSVKYRLQEEKSCPDKEKG